ncbi:AAA family ATPase [Clostridium botulinum]|uniref:AAA family ATPase n=1 Tax=Clostridium botulinum TaxID=1491 RepID=UPI001E5A0CEB|nr:AAA family ATPase [Clostridium botulinum C/D]MCD3288217.1 AAA family ATPase [Clostridium botulinum C/D]MCD3291290.1 AAA family ATPase [Clostridium botulinum C/D]MCD3301774.1 AAA family ATPase [Clostridium botulinum C/D]
MELIYVYIDKFSDFIEKQEFIFSQKFNISYNKDNETLLIKERDYVKNFFGEKIKNISLIIGKNGTGKTTILDLLGMKNDDRKKNSVLHKDKYFLIYHIKDDIFAIEGYGLDLIKDIVMKLPLKGEWHITEPYSILIEKNNDTYKYIGYIQFPIEENERAINEKIVYVNVRAKFNERYLKTSFLRKSDYTAFANRFYGNDIGITEKYDLLKFLIKDRKQKSNDNRHDEVIFTNTNVKLTIEPTLYSYRRDEKRLNLKLPIASSKKGFSRVNKDDSEKTRSSSEDKSVKKYNFILSFLEKYIHESFNEGVLSRIKESGGDTTKEEKEIQKKIDNLYSHIGNENLYDNQIKYLLKIAKIVDDRIEEYIELGDENNFYNAVEDFVSSVAKLNEDFFENQYLNIPIDSTEMYIVDLLKVIDKYFNNDDKNNLKNDIKIKFENLSEGENEFLDVLTRIRESLKNSNVRYGDTVILLLDEPDRRFHPEWSRRFIAILLNTLSELENVKSKYQIIISTHSPFMVSDVPSDNLILLDSGIEKSEKDEKNTFKTKNKESISETFGNNIHTILSNEFFLKSTIGEFSKIKIQESIRYMMEYKKYINQNLTNIPLEFQNLKLEEKKKEIKYLIKIIGEPLIKRKLVQHFQVNKKIMN